MNRQEIGTFTNIVRQLQREAQYIKNRQYIGKDSILGYRTISEDDYDLHVSLPSGGASKKYIMTLDHETSDLGAIIKVYTFWSTASSDVMATYIPPWANGADARVDVARKVPMQGDKTEWYVGVVNTDALLGAQNVWIKFFFEGTDTGEVSFTPIV